jgi:hypothetical protein
MLKRAEVSARALGMQLQLVEARSPEDFDGGIRAHAVRARERDDCVDQCHVF